MKTRYLFLLFFLVLTGLNAQRLVKAEYFIDKDPGSGKGITITFSKGDSISLTGISKTVTSLGIGTHILGVRVKDSLGYWSPPIFSPFSIIKPIAVNTVGAINMLTAEYFYGNIDPGPGKGISISSLPSTDSIWDISAQVILPSTMPIGSQKITFRTKQNNGFWSANQTFTFDVCLGVPPTPTVTGTTICGGSGSGSMVASGATTLRYAWYANSWGGTPVYTSTGAGDNTFTTPTLTSSTYYYVAQTGSNCNSGRNPALAQVISVLPSPVSPNVTRCGPGRFTLTAAGAPLDGSTYRWYATATSTSWLKEGNTFTSDSLLASRTYSIAVVSNGGKCESPVRTTISTVIKTTCNNQTITFPKVQDLVYGFDNFVKLKATASSGLPITYSWKGSSGYISNDTLYTTFIGDLTVCANQPGDLNNNPAPSQCQTIKVTAGSSAVSILYNQPVCTGSQMDLIATTIRNGRYQWKGPNGFTSSLQNPAVYNVSMADSGRYTVTVYSNNDTLTTFVKVKVFKSPERITLSSKKLQKCAKEYQLFTVTDSINSYQWFFNAKKLIGAIDSTLKPTLTGVYSISAFDKNGCPSSSSPTYVDVTPDSLPSISRLLNPNQLKSTPGSSYQWYIDNYIFAASNSQQIPLVFNGTYTVKVTSSNGCEKISQGYTINDGGLINIRKENINSAGQLTWDQYQSEFLTLVPTPASDQVQFLWTSPIRGDIQMLITNSIGETVQKFSVNKDSELLVMEFNVSNLSSGVYHAHLDNGLKKIVGKLVVVK